MYIIVTWEDISDTHIVSWHIVPPESHTVSSHIVPESHKYNQPYPGEILNYPEFLWLMGNPNCTVCWLAGNPNCTESVGWQTIPTAQSVGGQKIPTVGSLVADWETAQSSLAYKKCQHTQMLHWGDPLTDITTAENDTPNKDNIDIVSAIEN